MEGIDGLVTRQEVSGWRDRLILTAWNIVNGAAKDAREAFDRHLDEAGIIDSIWDPAGFTYERIDNLMRATLSGAIDGLFRSAADELSAIDPRFAPLAKALSESARNIVMPVLNDRPETGNDNQGLAPPPVTDAGTLTRISSYIADTTLTKGAKDWAVWAGEVLSQAGDAASRTVQSKTGLHDRLRRAGIERLQAAWMGMHADPRPVMGQVIALADEAGNGARSMAL